MLPAVNDIVHDSSGVDVRGTLPPVPITIGSDAGSQHDTTSDHNDSTSVDMDNLSDDQDGSLDHNKNSSIDYAFIVPSQRRDSSSTMDVSFAGTAIRRLTFQWYDVTAL